MPGEYQGSITGDIRDTQEAQNAYALVARHLAEGRFRPAPVTHHEYVGGRSRCQRCGMTLNAPIHTMPEPVARFGGTGWRDAADAYEHGCSFVGDWWSALELARVYHVRDGVPMVVLRTVSGYTVVVATVGLYAPFDAQVCEVVS